MSGCGCGRDGAGCACEGTGAAGVAQHGVYTQPVFSDGQLLCADDLEALVTWARGKHRLHNRYLVGDGIVCGLEVTCSRRAEGSVLVRAGYALDCCGNDIVVPCDLTLDVIELIALLPRDAGCVDPCPPPVQDDKGKGTASGTPPSQPRSYELFVEYTEIPGDLMAPYSTGEASSRACQPTRIREGYRFGVRCARPPGKASDDLIGALGSCAAVKDRLDQVEKAGQTAGSLIGRSQEEALPEPPPDEELQAAREALAAGPDLQRAVQVAGMALRLAAAGRGDTAREVLDEVRAALDPVRDAAARTPSGDPLASAQVDALAAQVESLAGRLHEPRPTMADRLLVAGAVAGPPVTESLRSVVLDARDWALCWMEQRPGTRCDAERTLLRLAVPRDDDPEALRRAAEGVATAIRGILLDCLCSAVSPPCRPCDDPALVLAVVTVANCEVVEVCTAGRRHAITGPALRYWLPFEAVERALAKVCCGDGAPSTLLGLLEEARTTLQAALTERLKPPPRVPSAAQSPAAAGTADAAPAPADNTTQGDGHPPSVKQQRLVTMLNSQVQTLQARVRKLELAAARDGDHG
jgi:hypothetical protein